METDPSLADDRLTRAGLLFEAAAGLQATLERRLAEECGLSGQSFELLLRLARSPDQRLRMCDLAEQVVMSPSGITRAIDRLVDAGLVTREHCPDDRRVAWAQLTPDGLARVEAAVPVHLDHLQEHLFASLDAAEQAQLETMLRAVRDRVRPGAASPGHPPTR